MTAIRQGACILILACLAGTAFAQREYGFANTRPSGQPYLSSEDSVRRFTVAPGYEVTCFAAEPDVINPVAFSIDERGRVWVVECFEYPSRTPKGKMPRDRIKILEDTTGSGKADKVTLWAEGKDLPRFDLATGIEVGYGGAFLGAAPYLLFLKDSKGAGRCDLHEVLLKGFGSQDTHETLNTLSWGPDGRLQGLHGIFTQSQVDDVKLNAALWRYHPVQKRFDIFAEGTSNPWGLDYDARGQAFLAACVIPHAFHMVQGGTYIRQAGASFNQHAYGLLREISDHTHHAESGWAHAGLLVMEGDHVPKEYQGSLLIGSIHGCSIKRDVLVKKGSTFTARHAPDFLVSGDKNFRPINLRWGPDGAIYLIDWHDQNPCHQAPPDSWDQTRGRIYKIQRKGAKPSRAPDLATKTNEELISLLTESNPYWHRTAQRILAERSDPKAAALLRSQLGSSQEEMPALRALWALSAMGALGESDAVHALNHPHDSVRAWAVRVLGEQGSISKSTLSKLESLAEIEKSAVVRSQLASTAQRLHSHETLPVLHALMRHSEDSTDSNIPLLIWLAYEPQVTKRSGEALDWLAQNASGNALITGEILPRAVRRIVASGSSADLNTAIAFLDKQSGSQGRRATLDGILQGLATRQADPPASWSALFARLREDPDPIVHRLARRLAVQLRDATAARLSLAIALDSKQGLDQRIDAIRELAIAHPADALSPLSALLGSETQPRLLAEVCRALAAYDGINVAERVLSGWKAYPPAVKTEAINLLGSRKEWAQRLLSAVGDKTVARTEITDSFVLRLRNHKDPKLNSQIEAVWGKIRESTPGELNKLIERTRAALDEGSCSAERGKQIFEAQCAKCHRFEGNGFDVGPILDGAARDIDYLLINILDPNRVVGQPYYTRFATMKNGRIETGLVVAEDEKTLTLRGENAALKALQKSDIEELNLQEKSLMPEGLNTNLSAQDFRDLIRYLMASPFLTDVEAAGPFPVDTLPALIEPPSWKKLPTGVSGRIRLPAVHGSGELATFVRARVTIEKPYTSRLLLGAGQHVEAWLNGQPTYKGKAGSVPSQPDQEGVAIPLVAGRNELIFKVVYRGSNEALFARILDPERRVRVISPQ